MAPYQDVQTTFLNMIKESMPKNLSFADEIADLLGVSKDSAYRRLRGETTLSLAEIQKLCSHFGVSIDKLLGTSSDQITFQYRSVDGENLTFEDYLYSILGNLKMINTFEGKELIYLAKDIPPFHYFVFRPLGEFKCFFWMKTILNLPEYADKKFSFEQIQNKYLEVGDLIWAEYVNTPSLEVWSYETINITLRQIEFYCDCGLFENYSDSLILLDYVEKLIKHIKNQAELGQKFHVETDEKGTEGNFQLYSNEISIADTTIFFKMGDTKITFITHNTLNILATSNQAFCENTYNHIQNLIRKSSLISSSSVKERTKFFNRLNKKINKVRDEISKNV